MIRFLGVLCVGSGSALIALYAVCQIKGRVRDLGQLVNGLEAMVRELDYALGSLPELFQQAAAMGKGPVERFFLLCAQGSEQLMERTFCHVWQEALDANDMAINETDCQILEQLGPILGRYDRIGLRRAISTAASQLEERRKTAEVQMVQRCKLYGALSLTAGGFLIILLL